ncbi:MAG: DegT/DnrJ/EryC1/StrS aminotransferase family protein [Coriobacteriia bacterium]|nr:DegT/DnrJ/EryC1/StrS aminotransferase family protein [Coriobacteriia bacterium]
MKIDFSPPDINEDDITAVSETLRSRWITTGARVLEFEEELAKWCKTAKVAALNSATAALQCALEILAIGPGDEVITSAYTYTASASVICHVGATPVIVDVLPDSYDLDPEAVVNAVTRKTKAIIPVDIGGVMYDYNTLRAVVNTAPVFRKYEPRPGTLQELFTRLPIIADSAHSFGATYHGQPSGSVADFTAFSFHAVKNLTTAEGGALTWRRGLGDGAPNALLSGEALDEEIYRRIKLYSLHGQDKDALAKSQGGWEYDIIAPLYKCNLTDIAAALGISQLKRYEQTLNRRRELVDLYTDLLTAGAAKGGYDLDILAHTKGEDTKSSMHLMMVRLLGRDDAFRRRLIIAMADRDVACNVHFKPLPMLSAYAMLGFDIANFPNAWSRYENEVSLPLHTLLTDEDVKYVCDCFAEAYAQSL